MASVVAVPIVSLLALLSFVVTSCSAAGAANRIFNFQYGNPGGPKVFLQPVNHGAPNVEDSMDLGFSKENHNKAAFLSYGYDDFDLYGVNVAVPPKKPSSIALYDTLEKTFSDINYSPPPMDSYDAYRPPPPSMSYGPLAGAERRSDVDASLLNTHNPSGNSFGALVTDYGQAIKSGFEEWKEGMKALFKLEDGKQHVGAGRNQFSPSKNKQSPVAIAPLTRAPTVYAGGYGHRQSAAQQTPTYGYQLQTPLLPETYAAQVPAHAHSAGYNVMPPQQLTLPMASEVTVEDSTPDDGAYKSEQRQHSPAVSPVATQESLEDPSFPGMQEAIETNRGHSKSGLHLGQDQLVSHAQPMVESPSPLFEGGLQAADPTASVSSPSEAAAASAVQGNSMESSDGHGRTVSAIDGSTSISNGDSLRANSLTRGVRAAGGGSNIGSSAFLRRQATAGDDDDNNVSDRNGDGVDDCDPAKPCIQGYLAPVIAAWRRSRPQGPAVIVFPDPDIELITLRAKLFGLRRIVGRGGGRRRPNIFPERPRSVGGGGDAGRRRRR